MSPFLKVCEIEKIKKNIEKNIFLTFDIDWASDQVLNYTLNLIENLNVKATFFVTHKTPVLERIRENPNIELGIHPNFNFLLNGDFRYGKTYESVIEYYLKIVPDAVSVRSHSLVQSSNILNFFDVKNIKYDLNLYIPRDSNISLKPISTWLPNLIRLPHFWEDDFHFSNNNPNNNIHYYTNFEGLKIFDFHPIHVFLNIENISRYKSAKPFLKDFEKLNSLRNINTFGCETFLKNLINEFSN